jgi:hypothetical protein
LQIFPPVPELRLGRNILAIKLITTGLLPNTGNKL